MNKNKADVNASPPADLAGGESEIESIEKNTISKKDAPKRKGVIEYLLSKNKERKAAEYKKKKDMKGKKPSKTKLKIQKFKQKVTNFLSFLVYLRDTAVKYIRNSIIFLTSGKAITTFGIVLVLGVLIWYMILGIINPEVYLEKISSTIIACALLLAVLFTANYFSDK